MAIRWGQWGLLLVSMSAFSGILVIWKRVYRVAETQGGLSANDLLPVVGFLVLTVLGQHAAVSCNKRVPKELGIVRIVLQDFLLLLIGFSALVIMLIIRLFKGPEGVDWGAWLLESSWHVLTSMSAGIMFTFNTLIFGRPLPLDDSPSSAAPH